MKIKDRVGSFFSDLKTRLANTSVGRIIFKQQGATSDELRLIRSPEEPSIVFMCFPIDTWTHTVKEWIEDIADTSMLSERDIHSLLSPSTQSDDIRALLHYLGSKKRIKIFCGHGSNDALLGPAQHNSSDFVLQGTLHGVVFDQEMISTSPGSMFAFCCRSAKAFGRVFASYEGKVFLGFDEELPITDDPEYLSSLERIFKGVSSEVLSSGSISESHEKLLIDLCENEMKYYKYGDGRTNSGRFLYRLYLVSYKRSAKRFQG